ncbi:MAG TPA: OmpH family outer membrane protein [Blastocatellia bacterium]|nr:OmpH family outer membrane protein [Blastocatellia bacterium]
MKPISLMMAAFALVAIITTASAQQVSAPAQAGAPALLPKGKVAVINTNVFQEKIGEYRAKIEELNRQFEPRVKELQSLANKITALENTLKTQSSTLTPARIAEMTEQIEDMKRDYKRKAEDLEAEGNRARNKALEPISQKMGKFAEEYAARKGIVMMIDLANAIQSNTLIWFDRRADVTEDFINEYNKANPVPGAAAPANPAPKKPGN